MNNPAFAICAALLAGLLANCASVPPPSPDLSFVRGCWITQDHRQTMRWLPPHPASRAILGVLREEGAGLKEPERLLLEPSQSGLILVRTPAGSGAAMETFALVGGGPFEAEFAGANNTRLFLQGGPEALEITYAAAGAQAVLFRGVRDGCD
jgi:hypothetical protein